MIFLLICFSLLSFLLSVIFSVNNISLYRYIEIDICKGVISTLQNYSSPIVTNLIWHHPFGHQVELPWNADLMFSGIFFPLLLSTFNPNQYSQAKVELFKNWSVSDLYEPGSTLKPVNVAIALKAKAITPETTVNDGGSVRVGPG